MASFDVIILGGGIVGCACARECAQAGLRAAIIESRSIAGGATGAAMGHVVVMDGSPAQLALTAYSRSLWIEMSPLLPANVEYETRGTVWIAADEEELAEVHAKQKTCAAAGISATILDANELAAAEPNLRAGLAGGLLVTDDGVLYPPNAAAFFLQEAVQAGAVLLRGDAAVSAVAGVVTLANSNTYKAERIVIATGVDTSLVPALPIQQRKGHLVITDSYPGFVHHQLVELGYLKSAHTLHEDSVAFNLQPRQTGQLVIGSSRQSGNEDPAVEEKMMTRMLERACAYMPGLANLSRIRAWTGFRAATPDKLPLIGPTEDTSVLLAMGFEGLGITSAPGAARLVTDHVLGRASAIDTAPYLPARFSMRLVPQETLRK